VQEPAPEVQALGRPVARALGQPVARAERVAPREVLVPLAGAHPALPLPDRQLRNLATLGLRQAASRRAWAMTLQQLPLPARDFLRRLGRSLSIANMN
jgi:hypothetical protein